MDYKSTPQIDLAPDFAIYEKRSLISLQEDYDNAKLLINRLKNDKKKLQEALRTVITERNTKAEKLKNIRGKYAKIENFLKKEADFIKEIKQDYVEYKKNNQNSLKNKGTQSKYKNEIESLYENMRNGLKNKGIILKYDEGLDKLINRSIQKEN